MTKSRRMFASATLAAVLTATVFVPSAAATGTPAPTLDTSAAEGLLAEYTSLSAALLQRGADMAGSDLETYVATNEALSGLTKGASLTLQGKTKQGKKVSAASSKELTKTLGAAGVALDLSSFTTLQDAAAAVVKNGDSADAKITKASANWAKSLTKLHAPKLTTPSVAKPKTPKLDMEALGLGLLMDKALAKTVANSSDLLEKVAKTGVGTDALSKSFGKEMTNAWKESGRNLASAMPNKCTAGMMAVAATGKASAASEYIAGCNPACITGGLYLNGRLETLFADPNTKLSNDVNSDGEWSQQHLAAMPDWMSSQIWTQNEDLVDLQLRGDDPDKQPTMCGEASASAKGALSSTLPGVFGALQPRK